MLKPVAIVTSTIAIAGFSIWFVRSEAKAEIEYQNTAIVAKGKVLYDENCASCHGENLEGQEDWRTRGDDGKLPAPPHNETGHTWHHPSAQLFAITKYGTEALVGGDYRSDMRGFVDDLTDPQIWAVLSFIKSRWPDKVIAAHNDIERRN